MKVLLVDDDETLRILISKTLSSKGHDIVEAENGAVGVEKATSDVPDLIIMDLHMPVMDGFQATKAIKASDEAGHVPILVFTAENATANYEAIYEAGADGYVPKPVELERLVNRVSEFAAA